MRALSRVLVLLAACSFHTQAAQDGPTNGSADSPFPADLTWKFATAADYLQPGADPARMAVEAFGGLTPGGFTYGGLVVHALAGTELWTHSTSPLAFSATDGQMPSGAALWSGVFWDVNTPLALPLNVPDATQPLTLWLEGEMHLQMGDTISLAADDVGFLDIRAPVAAPFAQVVTSTQGTTGQSTFTAPATDWYPIRMGYAANGGTGHLDFRRCAAAAGSCPPFKRTELRARGDAISGALRTAFTRQVIGGSEPIWHMEEADILSATFTSSVTGKTSDWSATWSGQLYSATGGSYTLATTSSNGSRLVIAGQANASHFALGDNGTGTAVQTATLRAGWNDVAVEYNDDAGATPALALGIQSGPEGALATLPRARVRAVDPAGYRLATASDFSTQIIDQNNTAQITLHVDGFAGETVTAIDIGTTVASAKFQQLVFALQAPGAATPTAFCTNCEPGNLGGALVLRFQPAPAGASQAATGDWIVTISNNAGNSAQTSTVSGVFLTLHVAGGPDVLAKQPTWTSEVRDLGGTLAAVDSVAWMERVTTQAARVELRACAMADCSDGAWTTATQGRALALPNQRYLQVRVSLFCDGFVDSELDGLAIYYRLQ